MRTISGTVAAVALALGAAGSAGAATVPFTGTLTIQVGDMLSPLDVRGSGTATVNGSAGGPPIGQLTIPSGAFETVLSASLSSQKRLDGIRLSLSNGRIALTSPGTCTAGHPNVSCPGGALAGFGGLQGRVVISGAGGLGNLEVPISVVGGGSTTGATVGPLSIQVSGAGWTTGTAKVFDPDAGTTLTLSGTRNTTPGVANTASLTLVTPVQVFTSVTGFVPSFASINLHFVPEPGTLLLLGSGVVGLAAWGRRRQRRR